MFIHSKKKTNSKQKEIAKEVDKKINPVIKEKTISHKKKNKKSNPAPVVEEAPVVEKEKVEEEIDLSEWLKEENIED